MPTRPALFSILAFLGLVVGSSGAWSSIERARSLLASRDRFVAAVRAAHDRVIPSTPVNATAPVATSVSGDAGIVAADGDAGVPGVVDSDGGAGDGGTAAAATVEAAPQSLSVSALFSNRTQPPRDEVLRIVEKQADVVYSRRGVALPMAAMSFILSLLLFAGCARAMRGLAWGASAWSLAAVASIPYQLLDAVFTVVQVNDLSVALEGMAVEPAALTAALLGGSVQIFGAVMKAVLLLVYFVSCAVYLRRPAIRALFTSSGN